MPIANGLDEQERDPGLALVARALHENDPIKYLKDHVQVNFSAFSEEVEVTTSRVGNFVAASGDDQWFHVDESRAAEVIGGKLVAQGFLVASMLASTERALMTGFSRRFPKAQLIEVGFAFTFKRPVPIGSKICSSYQINIKDVTSQTALFDFNTKIYRNGGKLQVAEGTRSFFLRA